jgi:peptidoglycan/xylan/chitin deacetylase (PgdA/CDA1 family)
MKIFFTIDTEVYPLLRDWRNDALHGDMQRDIYGETNSGPVGLRFQLETFNKYGLKAVFFIESLFASAIGIEPLRDIVRKVQEAGHEVQLHLHPEWLAWTDQPCLEPRGRETINLYSREEQSQLVAQGLQNLRSAGVVRVTAFRAGDYAANRDTLQALRVNGLTYDTSLNCCYDASLPDLTAERRATQPLRVDGIWEVPVTYWRTPPLGCRHAQLVSSSVAELTAALWHAKREHWASMVIVSHSFELLRKRRKRPADPRADAVVVRRFVRLCQFLDKHRNMFETTGFNDWHLRDERVSHKPPLTSPLHRTMLRNVEQLYRRLA